MRITPNYVWGMRQSSAYDEEGGEFSPPTATNERLTCDLLIAGGGLSGLSAAEAALRRGLDVVVIEKGAFGKDGASGLNAGQFLTGWAKPVDVMLAELAQQELRRGLPFDQAQLHAQRRCGHSCAARSRDASGLPGSTITTTCAHPCSMAR
jgi:glycine/D-amino acid oxidase-like deaminating enzyme